MGLRLHVWSEDTFKRIPKGLDAKFVMHDELIEEQMLFSVARILIDFFQSEPIQEWVSIRCDGTVFHVYIKEFSGEVLSRQEKNQEVEGVGHDDVDDKRAVEIEVAIDDSMNRELEPVKHGMRMEGEADMELMKEKGILDERERVRKERGDGKAQYKMGGHSDKRISESNGSSYPFPFEFRPCSNGIHAHKELKAD
ncbi:hypothetical protein PIB30_051238 [Stylosanthes scabra]|uniref:DUF4283 domain-containing protein n=1 Tax=Stylosanthes scabra TaxID=79078 RepID=A0ABU6WFY1_9FABA|nr:hypothetical protein [Stylosanthes scabra]